jgi:glycosyltransferase involved in cell wall biosynthesis
MPVRDGLPYLAEAIDSIVAQTEGDWQLVVVDNGSSDGSDAYVHARMRDERRLTLVHCAAAGVANALNYGLDYCAAPWVARMDADDRSLPRRFERQLSFLQEHGDVLAVSCWATYINRSGARVALAPNELSSREAFEDHMTRFLPVELVHPGAFIPREALEAIGRYRPEFETAEDVDLWSRLSERGPVMAVPEFLLDYRLHGGSVVARNLKLAQQRREWAWACAVARRTGRPEPSWLEYQAGWGAAPPWRRLQRERGFLAERLLRTGRERLAGGDRWRALACLAAGSALRPVRSLPRLKRQAALRLRRYAPDRAA